MSESERHSLGAKHGRSAAGLSPGKKEAGTPWRPPGLGNAASQARYANVRNSDGSHAFSANSFSAASAMAGFFKRAITSPSFEQSPLAQGFQNLLLISRI
jgi:hypothetical protein